MSDEIKMPIPNAISGFFHCGKCIDAGRKDILAIGWTKKGLQVWCETCDTNVQAFDLEGTTMTNDLSPEPIPEHQARCQCDACRARMIEQN